MERSTKRLDVTSKSNSQSKARSGLVLKLSGLLLVSLSLVACQTTQTGVPTVGIANTPISDVQCWPKRIRYSKKDTTPTKDQIREHNLTGHNLNCW